MKLVIAGREYELDEAVYAPAMGDLIDLKRATKGYDEPVSVRTITEAVSDLGDVYIGFAGADDVTVADFGGAMLDFFDDVGHLTAFAAMVFLCRRKAGEPCTWEDALSVSPSAVQFRFDVEAPDDEEDGADPKDPSTSEDAGADPDEAMTI
jgi:hypothetical protein